MTFWRALLTRHARFDVLAHRLLPVGAPTRHALRGGDVAVPDMGRLRRLLEGVGVRARLWVTGISFASAATQAPWLEHAFELLWRGGVDTVTYSAVRDPAGVFRRDGTAKPAATAFRFPFVAGGDQVWTRAPVAGTLQIQRNGRTVRTVAVRAGQVLLLKHVRTPVGASLRGVVDSLESLAWRVAR